MKLNVVDQGSENSSYQYILVIFTGARVNSGTTASVCFSLKDEYGETEPKLLLNENRSLFNRDQVDAFKICFNRRLGDVPTLRVWHDNKGRFDF